MVMRVIQLSDCHVSAAEDARYRGVDARGRLESLLGRVTDWAPDLVLATGDLSEDASEASYQYLASALSVAGAPVLAIPGNHDDPARLRQYFADTAVDRPLARECGGWQLVMLNSAVEHEIAGRLDRRQLADLDRVLGDSPLPKLVALHHQPMPVGSLWIDRYPLQDPEPFWAVLARHPLVQAVTWGHIHHAFEGRRGDITALGAPSTVCNSQAAREKFTVDPAGAACRWFELDAGGEFRTGVMVQPGSGIVLGQNDPQNDVDQDAGKSGRQDGK